MILINKYIHLMMFRGQKQGIIIKKNCGGNLKKKHYDG